LGNILLKTYIKRIEHLYLPDYQSCFLWGACKTGKSTFLKENYPDALWGDLLEADNYRKYLRETRGLRQELENFPKIPLIIVDEVQRVPEFLNEIHWLIENRDVQFILCGSSYRKLKTSGANLLGGRAWRYIFLPFCYPKLKKLRWPRILIKG